MVASKTIENFLHTIDSEGCRIKKLPSRIWVFGGWLSNSIQESLRSPVSMRDFFLAKAFSLQPGMDELWLHHLDKPEEYPEWHSFSGYSDLHEFERDACYIANSVIIFLESPGALAEAGALIIDEHLPENIFLVTRDEHYSAQSYIRLGPIKRVQNLSGEICVINGLPGDNLNDEDFKIIKEHFSAWNPNLRRTEKLNPENKTHQLLFIGDLVNILLISKIDDLIVILNHLKININRSKLEKYLNLLNFFKVIVLIKRGLEVFYKAHPDFTETIDYRAVRSKRFSRSSFLAARLEEIKLDKRASYIWSAGN